MATYKLIQDIEAEDHILGPLTLRQFIFGMIAAFLAYLSFISVVKHVPFLLVVLVPPLLFCAFFAVPFGGDQPTELWALAKLRFWFKPRRRIWSQSGIKELVTITVPKKIEHIYSDGLSQTEVKSRLQALANTLDSRGWAIKHIDAVGYVPAQTGSGNPERLINIAEVPQEVPNMTASDDMLDTDHNPVAQQFQTMIDKSTRDYRQKLVDQLRQPLPVVPAVAQAAAPAGAVAAATAGPAPQWFMNHNPAAPPSPVTPVAAAPAVASAATPTAAAPLRGVRMVKPVEYGNLRTLQPAGAAPAGNDAAAASVPAPAGDADNGAAPAVTANGDPAILSLSKNNDLNVATLAREAQRAKGQDPQEVVISLH